MKHSPYDYNMTKENKEMGKLIYFGTDGRYWVLPSEYRKYLNDSSLLIIQELYPRFAEYHQLNDHRFGNLFEEEIHKTNSKLLKDLSDSMLDAKLICNYGIKEKFYVTNIRLLACANAHKAYGGAPYTKIAYLMLKASELLGWSDWKEDSWMTVAKNVVTKFVELDSSPVLFTFTEIDEGLWNDLTRRGLCVFEESIDEKSILNLINNNINLHSPEIVDKDFLSELEKSINRIPFLYHGTDARIIRMTEEERNNYLNTCHAVVNYLWDYFKPLYRERKLEQYKDALSPKDNPYLYANVYEKLSMVDMKNNGCQQYQYGDLYLTSRDYSADNYARRSFAGGEIGLMAYRMIEAAEIIGFDGLYENKAAVADIETIKKFALEENEPVIIKVKDLDPKYLQTDTGEPIEWSSIRVIPQLYRYDKETVLDINDTVKLENEPL